MALHECTSGPTPACQACRAEGPIPALRRVLEVQRRGEAYGQKPMLRTQTDADQWVRQWEAKAARQARLEGFSDDAKAAMTANPDYFVWWYTAKSIGLGVVGAIAAYLLGRFQGQRERRA
jgi:hypothetical protein